MNSTTLNRLSPFGIRFRMSTLHGENGSSIVLMAITAMSARAIVGKTTLFCMLGGRYAASSKMVRLASPVPRSVCAVVKKKKDGKKKRKKKKKKQN